MRILLFCLGFLFVSTQANAISLFNVKDGLVQFLLEQVNDPGEFEITVGKVTTPDEGGTRLNNVSLSDSEGVWMTVEAAEFNWNKSRLLRGEIEIDYIRMVKPVILRAPSSNNPPAVEEPDTTRTAADNWPRSPLTLSIEKMELIGADVREGLLPQRLQFDATGAVRDEGDLQSLTLKIDRKDSVDGLIDLSYQRNFEAKTLDLSVLAREAAGGLVSALAGLPADVPVAAKIEASGPDSDWNLNLALIAQDMVNVQGQLALGWSGVPLQVDANLSVEPGEKLPDNIQMALSPKAQLRLVAREGEAGRVMLEDAHVYARDLSLKADGYILKDLSDMDIQTRLVVDGKLAELADGVAFSQVTFDGMVKGSPENLMADGIFNIRDLSGAAYDISTLNVDGQVQVTGETIAFNVDGAAKRPRIDKLSPAALGTITFATQGTFDQTLGQLDLQQTTLDSRLLTAMVSGGVAVNDSRLDIDYDITVPDVSPIAQAYGQVASGRVQDTGTLKGTFDNLDIRGKLAAGGLTSNGMRIGTFTATHTNTIAPNDIQGTLDTRLTKSDYGDGTMDASYRMAGSTLTLNSLTADMLGSAINAKARVNLDTMLVDGDVDLRVRDLRQIGQIAGVPLAGSGTINARLQPQGNKQGLTATAGLRNIVYDAITVGAVDMKASTPALGSKSAALQLDATVNDLATEGVELDTVTLQANGPQSNLPVTLAVRGTAQDEPVTLDANAVVSLGGAQAQTRISVAQFDLAYAEQEVALDSPLLVTLGQNTTSLQNLNLRLPKDGRISGDFDLLPTGLRGALTVDALDLTIVNDFQPDTIDSGLVNASVTVDTRPASAMMDMDLTVKRLQVTQAQATGQISLTAKGDWDGTTANLDATALGSFTNPISVTASLPVRATNAIMPDIQMSQPFSAAATWAGDLEELWQYAPLPEHLLAGQTDLDFKASGTLENPVFSGGLTIADGLYQNITAGTTLTDLTVTTSLSTQRQVTLKLTANDGASGRVTSDIDMNFGEASTLDASLTAERAVLVRRDDVVARMDIDMQATGPLVAPAIKGEITILDAEVRLVNNLPPSVVDLGEIRTTDDPPREDSDADPSAGPTLDIAVNAPGRIYIRGRGLDSEWATGLKIAGAAASPRITGQFYALRGRLDFLGKAFDLQTGEITFRGTKKINPKLDVVLARETSDIRGNIIVAGRASSPELQFTSVPSLPDDEILPRLIFGRSKQSLSAAEGLQLASGIATLTGGGAGPLDAVRAALGFDALRIESDDEGNSALAVGRYVQEGVYIGAKQALDGQGGAVVIELDVTDDITADVEVGQGGSATSAGVNYQFDF